MDVRLYVDYKVSWVLKNWCFWTVVLEKTLESPLDCKEIQPVHPKGDQSWVFIGRSDAEAETPIFWPLHAESTCLKRPWCWEDWRQEEKGITEDEMVGYTPGVGEWQGGLACCSPWGRKESDTDEWLNWTELKIINMFLARPSMTNFKMTVRAGCAVSDWSPLPLSLQALKHWLSG